MAYGKAVHSAKEATELGMVHGDDTASSSTGSWSGTDDFDAFGSDCDEAPCAKVVLIANLSSYDSAVISKVPILEPTQDNSILDNCVQEMYYSKQPTFDPASDIKITSDSNIISYDQYLKETEILTAELERYKERVRMFEERQNVDLNDREKYIESLMNDMILNKNAKFTAFQKDINSLKFSLSENVKENEYLMTKIDVLKTQSKEKENKYIGKDIDFENKIKELENIVFKVGQSAQTMHMLTKPQVFYDDTHKQALGYQNPFYLKKAQWIKPTLYDDVVISKQAFRLPISNPISEQLIVPPTPVKIEVPSEPPKVILVNKSFQKLKNPLAKFDKVVKERTTALAITEGRWGFEHTKECSVDKKCFEILKKELLENDQLLELIISQDLVHTALNSLEVIDESQLQAKEYSISKLRAHIATLKGKNVSDNNESVNNASVIAPGMFRIEEKSLIYNTSFLGEYECSSLALDRRRKKKDDFEVEVDLKVLEEELVLKVDDVSLVDGFFEGAFGGDGDKDFVMGEGVVVLSSLLVRSTKICLGRMMVSLIFLEGLEEEA
ncbi:hypothetical protein Tco_0299324 [Tanacetum coccineum]